MRPRTSWALSAKLALSAETTDRDMKRHIASKLFIVRDLLRGLADTLAYAYDARVSPPLALSPASSSPRR